MVDLPQDKITTFTDVSDSDSAASDNMINYWSNSSVKINRSSVLSSQREDPSFFVQSKSTYRPIPGIIVVSYGLGLAPFRGLGLGLGR